MLGNVMHPQIIDNLAKGLIARWNIKAEPRDVVKFITQFHVEKGNEQDDHFVSSGFPIGKIQSFEHLQEIKKEYGSKGVFYNITTGKTIKSGNPTIFYGDGWCVKRNTPQHQAMLKINYEEDQNSESNENSIEIDEYDGWAIVKDTKYIWSMKLEKIIGKFIDNKPNPLSQKTIEYLKSHDMPWIRVKEDDMISHKLP